MFIMSSIPGVPAVRKSRCGSSLAPRGYVLQPWPKYEYVGKGTDDGSDDEDV